MKKLLYAFAAMAFFAACNSNNSSSAPNADSTRVTKKLDYPYTIEHPDEWQRGDPENSLMVLKAIKAYETGNIEDCLTYFADSVKLELDQYERTVSKDTLKAIFTEQRSMIKNMKLTMDDWESVISPDKKYEYVTLWYKQVLEDSKGKIDSSAVTSDFRIQKGKIASIDEKLRRYAVKKM